MNAFLISNDLWPTLGNAFLYCHSFHYFDCQMLCLYIESRTSRSKYSLVYLYRACRVRIMAAALICLDT